MVRMLWARRRVPALANFSGAGQFPIHRSRNATASNVLQLSFVARNRIVLFGDLPVTHLQILQLANHAQCGTASTPAQRSTIGEVQLRALVVKPRAARSGMTLNLNSLSTGRVTG